MEQSWPEQLSLKEQSLSEQVMSSGGVTQSWWCNCDKVVLLSNNQQKQTDSLIIDDG